MVDCARVDKIEVNSFSGLLFTLVNQIKKMRDEVFRYAPNGWAERRKCISKTVFDNKSIFVTRKFEFFSCLKNLFSKPVLGVILKCHFELGFGVGSF